MRPAAIGAADCWNQRGTKVGGMTRRPSHGYPKKPLDDSSCVCWGWQMTGRRQLCSTTSSSSMAGPEWREACSVLELLKLAGSNMPRGYSVNCQEFVLSSRKQICNCLQGLEAEPEMPEKCQRNARERSERSSSERDPREVRGGTTVPTACEKACGQQNTRMAIYLELAREASDSRSQARTLMILARSGESRGDWP